MKRGVLFVGILMLSQFGLAQENLVVNGSFEEIDSCAIGGGDISTCTGWYDFYDYASLGPDVYSECSFNPDFDTQNNLWGEQIPEEGIGYAGFIVYLPESIGGTLIDTLREDSVYFVSISFSLGDQCGYATRGIGINFQDSAYVTDYTNYENVSEDLFIPDYITEKDGWWVFQSLYTAYGGESHLTIGLYQTLDSATFLSGQGGVFGTASYYYIDNVIVRSATMNDIYSLHGNGVGFSLHPNPTNSILKIAYSGERPISFNCYNITGKQLLSTAWKPELDVSEFPDGLYFLTVEFEDGGRSTQRFVVQH